MDRITDRPDIASAVYRGRKASTQTNKTFKFKMKLFYLQILKTYKRETKTEKDSMKGGITRQYQNCNRNESNMNAEFFWCLYF